MISFSAGQGTNVAAPAAPSIVERMACVMQEMRAVGHDITAETLAVQGDFTDAEVSRHAREAADLARSRAVRQIGHPVSRKAA